MAIRSNTLARSRRILRAGYYALGLAILAYLFGLFYFLHATSHQKIDETTRTDAAIVLTGGSGRIAAAIALLQSGLADRLFISGVNPETEPPEIAKLNGQSASLFRCCVVIGHRATNTIENASESAAWIEQNHYKSVRVITSDYHLPRAMLDFRMALPNVTLILHPVMAHPSTGLHLRLLTEYSKYLVTLCRFEIFQLLSR